MDIHEVLKVLPHRYPFVLIDRVLECDDGKRITALKNVTINEPFFQGHFPHHPVMPGVLIIEALAQAAAIMSFRSLTEERTESTVYYFVGIDNARFKRPVTAGDQLLLHVETQRVVKGIWKYAARATVADQLVAEAELMCTVRTL
jgi:3-hydroxyacyl-[acyl-carrier-protein] dehydratase